MSPERNLFDDPEPVTTTDHNPDPDVWRHHPAMPTRPDVLPKSSRGAHFNPGVVAEEFPERGDRPEEIPKPDSLNTGWVENFPELFDLNTGHLIYGIIEAYADYQKSKISDDQKGIDAFHKFVQEYLGGGRIGSVVHHFLKCKHCRDLRDGKTP